MANGRNVVRMPRQQMTVPAVPAQQSWSNPTWDGTQWCLDGDPCNPCPPGGTIPPFPCPPPGFPPPGCPPWYGSVNSPPWYPGANAGVSFGAPGAYPPNPVRGHFFWDGKTLWMFDGAAWVATGGQSGGGTTPPQASPPPNPVAGQQWFNGTTLYVWDGNAWVPVSQTKTTISATAPTGPNPGDLWYDGTQLRIWSGSAWMLVGPGATVGPVATTTHVFSVGTTSQGAPASNTWAVAPINGTPTVDPQSGWDAVTHQFMPKVAGTYMYIMQTESDIPVGGQFWCGLAKNDMGSIAAGVHWLGMGLTDSATAAAGWISVTGVAPMNGTTDFVRIWVYTSAGIWLSGGSIPNLDAYILP